MKVSEAIEKLTVKRDDALHFQKLYRAGDVGWSANESKAIAFNIAINTLEQIDEPQAEKVEVPEFVAEWYESHRGDLEYDLFVTTVAINNLTSKEDEAFEKWFDSRNTKPYETIIKMKLFGYTVKPKRWVVKYKPTHHSSGEWYFIGFVGGDATLKPNCASHVDCKTVIKFTDKSKAEAVATLVEGSVEEV